MTPASSNRRLSAQDAAFLYFERDYAPLHIGSVALFEGEIPYEAFVANLEAKLHLIPRYRQRVILPPFNLGHPTWEDDPEFTLRNHVYPVRLEPPGNDDQLAALTGELFAPRLSRDKPLWELYIVGGLSEGRSAIISKVHHCLVDGVAGIELLVATLELTPHPDPPPPPDGPFNPPPLPDPLISLTEAMWQQVADGWQRWMEAQLALLDPSLLFNRLRDLNRTLEMASPLLLRPVPRTLFHARPSGRRSYVWSAFPFGEVRAIRQALGGTVNDVVLAILAGALGPYLEEHGQPTRGLDFRVMIPVNVRREEEARALGNRISFMIASLPVGEGDPVARLEAIRGQMEALKRANQAGGIGLLLDLANWLPAPFQAAAGLFGVPDTLFNVSCTNVPGPMIPLYSVGHRLLAHYPLVPFAPGLALAVGVTSYNHMLYFGLIADPEAVPDLEPLRAFLDQSFLELRQAAGVPVTTVPELVTNGGAAARERAVAAASED